MQPQDRFADVQELLSALESGSAYASPRTARTRRPLLERDPLRFWQVTSLLLALAVLLLLLWR